MTGTVEPLVAIENLVIRFGSQHLPPVLDHISLSIEKGETLALVGESGSGKSLLAHTIAGIVSPSAHMTASRLEFDGVNLLIDTEQAYRSIRGKEIGVVFQNPRTALNPVLRIGDQISDVIREHIGFRGRKLKQAVVQALRDVQIPEPQKRASAYPGELSGGMCQRVIIAMALAANPALLIADEPTTGLDTTTQAAILELINKSTSQHNMATLLITHDLALAKSFTERMVVMHAGQIVEIAPADQLFSESKHPYTAALIRATLANVDSLDKLEGIPGLMPNASQSTSACRFATRCESVQDRCHSEKPTLISTDHTETHHVACWYPL